MTDHEDVVKALAKLMVELRQKAAVTYLSAAKASHCGEKAYVTFVCDRSCLDDCSPERVESAQKEATDAYFYASLMMAHAEKLVSFIDHKLWELKCDHGHDVVRDSYSDEKQT